MKYGHFDDEHREYVIDTPRTPLPWINYLGSEDFFTLVSNTAGGYSFYKDARLRRLTRYRYNASPLDQDGLHVYLKSDGEVWNIAWQPVQTELETYSCRHGLGYSVFESRKNGISAKQDMFVPRGDNCLLCRVEVTERRNHFAQLWANRVPNAFDTARDSFIGVYGSPAKPEAVFGAGCQNSIAHGWAPVGAMQFTFELQPGETQSVILGLGYIENPEDDKWESKGIINKKNAVAMQQRYSTDESFFATKQQLADFWNNLLSGFTLTCEDEHVSRMVNIWNQYQCMVTFNMSRSASYYESGMGRGMGFRDSCQDLFGFVHMIPERARERILDIAATQFQDGSAYHQYQPLTKKGNMAVGSGFNDDPLWLIAGTDAYIRETGDFSILNEMVAFDCDTSVAKPLMEHLRRSFRYTIEHLGPHGLPLIGRADWNDCLNLNCFSAHPGESFQITGPSEGPVAESVFIAGMFVKYGKAYANLCRHIGLNDEAAESEKHVSAAPVGSKECEEGQIFIEPQGMCVMAGIGKETGEAARAMKSVEERLDTKYGIVLLQPAYSHYYLNLGEISSYPPGYKENAGIFCHNNPWIVCAEAVLGHGKRAFEVYRRTCPSYLEDISEIHRTEPYVYPQMIAGKDAPTHGEAKNSWLTGTAAWTLLSITQAILGIVPTLDGLKVDPCLPPHMKGYTVSRRYRGATYHIIVDNSAGGQYGVKEVFVNGKSITGQVIPPAEPGTVTEVKVIMC